MSRTRRNPSSPVPEMFPEWEYALLTLREFLDRRDPGGKSHPADAYDSTVEKLNKFSWEVGRSKDSRKRDLTVEAESGDPKRGLVFRLRETGEIVAVLKDGILYRDRFIRIDPWMRGYNGLENLKFSEEREVKYPEQLEPRMDWKQKYPVVLRRVRINGEPFEVRAEVDPRTDQRDSVVILNSKGQIVARGDDEWGATLLRVAKEYRGRGLGKFLASLWYELNPRSESGGFTAAGRANAIAAWKQAVRRWLSMGWYSELIRSGRLTKERLKEILAGLSGGGRRSQSSLPRPTPTPEKQDIRLYVDESEVGFVLYDGRFLDTQDERYILGYGFLRDTNEHGLFFYRIEYEPEHREITSAIGLQLARNLGAPLYVEKAPADMIDWQTVPGAQYQDGYVTLSHDVLPIRQLAAAERKARNDPFRQRQYSLIELAESKWS